ncbi:MAG: hypothetical protein AAFV53_07565 [Myxococcota bacterium]
MQSMQSMSLMVLMLLVGCDGDRGEATTAALNPPKDWVSDVVTRCNQATLPTDEALAWQIPAVASAPTSLPDVPIVHVRGDGLRLDDEKLANPAALQAKLQKKSPDNVLVVATGTSPVDRVTRVLKAIQDAGVSKATVVGRPKDYTPLWLPDADIAKRARQAPDTMTTTLADAAKACRQTPPAAGDCAATQTALEGTLSRCGPEEAGRLATLLVLQVDPHPPAATVTLTFQSEGKPLNLDGATSWKDVAVTLFNDGDQSIML